jgi:4-hydroxyacetophenone monooxygenase
MTETVRDTAHDAEVDDLEAALLSANLPTLIGVLAHVTGDNKWLRDPFLPRKARGLDDNDSGGFSPEIAHEIRDAVADLVRRVDAGQEIAEQPSPSRVAAILSAVLGDDVPDDYGPLLCEELGIVSRAVPLTAPAATSDVSIGIIGAGMSGIAAAIALKDAGIPFDLLEKNPGVGGTWHENTYPGCGVDTPSSLYSYSFSLNHDWSRYFAKRDEVHSYFSSVVDEYDVTDHIEFGLEVVSAVYDSAAAKWTVDLRDSTGQTQERQYTALISAVGQVNRPSTPDIEGLGDFAGPVVHTAAWDPTVDVAGKSVAVIGTGASAMQLVPVIAPVAGHVTIFQRSRQWALPHPNYARPLAEGVKVLNELVPFYAGWYRLRAFWNFGDRLYDSLQIDPEWPHQDRSINEDNDRHRQFLTKYITDQLGDRQDLLESTLPDYPPYLKRPLIDNGWYKAILRDNVELVDKDVTRITANAVVDADGAEHPADILVMATGFRILEFLAPMEIRGRSGVTIREAWGKDDARAYLGVTVPDFPNLFILNGPNTFAGHGGSAILATEFQLRYTLQAIERLISGAAKSVEVRQEVFDAYNVELDAALDKMIWSHRGATNYFRNDAGRIVVNSPWKYIDYWRKSLQYDPAEYIEQAAETVGSSANKRAQ